MLGVSRERVSRELAAWGGKGILEQGRGRLIVRDRRPAFVVRAEFPALGEFATPYIARFPRTRPIFGPSAKHVRLRMSSTRGGLEVDWTSG